MEEAYSRLFNSFGIYEGHILGTFLYFFSELYREIIFHVLLGGYERIYVRIYVSPQHCLSY